MWQPQGIYNEFVIKSPTLLVGRESVMGLYNYPATRIAIIHSSSFYDFDLFRRVFKKKQVKFFLRSWSSEPSIENIRNTLGEIELYSPDTIIAVGGGSVIDGAKLCRLFFEFPYFSPKVSRLDTGNLKTNFIAIPTTIGSGAEVSSSAVYLDNSHKDMVVSHELQPNVVVYDERYIEHSPLSFLSISALDAVAHILEGYVSNIENSFVEIKAEEGLKLLREELLNLIENKHISYKRLQYAGYLGGIVQNHCIVGLAHAVAHQLTPYGFSHAEAVALLLPYVIRINFNQASSKYNSICRQAGFTDVNDLILFIQHVNEYSGVDKRFNELCQILLSNENNPEFLDNIRNDRGGKGNPIEITNEIIVDFIRSFSL